VETCIIVVSYCLLVLPPLVECPGRRVCVVSCTVLSLLEWPLPLELLMKSPRLELRVVSSLELELRVVSSLELELRVVSSLELELRVVSSLELELRVVLSSKLELRVVWSLELRIVLSV
jgi:hypothetical protein